MRNSKALGDWGENLAAEYLKQKKYRLLQRNLHLSFKELDLVAYDQETLVFIEVKTRSSSQLGTAIDMVGAKKLKNLRYAAMGYLQRFRPAYKKLRFDVIAIDIDRLTNNVIIKHYEDII